MLSAIVKGVTRALVRNVAGGHFPYFWGDATYVTVNPMMIHIIPPLCLLPTLCLPLSSNSNVQLTVKSNVPNGTARHTKRGEESIQQ